MQTQLSLASAPVRFTPPAHVKRWTGRVRPTILLPNLASLRIAGASAFGSQTGNRSSGTLGRHSAAP